MHVQIKTLAHVVPGCGPHHVEKEDNLKTSVRKHVHEKISKFSYELV